MVTVLNTSSILAALSSNTLVGFTKILNEVSNPNHVDTYMDLVKGVGHRIKHGHDLSFLPEIVDKFGLSGIPKFFKHLGIDLMSPHGIPVIPYTYEIGSSLGLSISQINNWMCLNIGDVVGGTFSVASSYYNYKLIITDKNYDEKTLLLIFLSSSVKLYSSAIVPNPITLATSVFDLSLVAVAATPLIKTYFIKGFSFSNSFYNSGIVGAQTAVITASSMSLIELYKNKKINKVRASEILEESSISGLSATFSTFSYDVSKSYFNKSDLTSRFIAVASYTGSTLGLKALIKLVKSKRVKSQNDDEINFSFVPTYLPA